MNYNTHDTEKLYLGVLTDADGRNDKVVIETDGCNLVLLPEQAKGLMVALARLMANTEFESEHNFVVTEMEAVYSAEDLYGKGGTAAESELKRKVRAAMEGGVSVEELCGIIFGPVVHDALYWEQPKVPR